MTRIPPLAIPSTTMWDKLDEQALGSPAASVTFSGIDPLYTLFAISGYIVNDANIKTVQLLVNNDSGANYSYQRISAVSSVESAARAGPGNNFTFTQVESLELSEEIYFVMMIAKPIAGQLGHIILRHGNIGNTANALLLELFGAKWNNFSDLIDRIDIKASTNNFDTGTRILLEGAKPA